MVQGILNQLQSCSLKEHFEDQAKPAKIPRRMHTDIAQVRFEIASQCRVLDSAVVSWIWH